MKAALLNSLRVFAPVLPLQGLVTLTRQFLFLPFYHTIQGEWTLPHIQHLYQPRTLREFESDLDYLLKHYQPLSLNDLQAIITGKQVLRKPGFHLSFDDGLREVYDLAAPVLQAKGVPATIFLNSAFLDNQDLFFRYKVSLLLEKINTKQFSSAVLQEAQIILQQQIPGKSLSTQLLQLRYQDQAFIDKLATLFEVNFSKFLEAQQPYLSIAQVKKLQSLGFTVGAHSIDHPQYNQLPLAEQLRQTQHSLQITQRQFTPTINCFSFPFTDDGVKQSFFNQLHPKNTLTFGCAGLKQDSAPRHFQRFPMEGSNWSASQLIKTEYLYYLVKSIFGKNQILRP